MAKRQHKTIILGGGYAGIMAALRLYGKAKDKTEITVIDANSSFTERIRLHQIAAGQSLTERPYKTIFAKTDIRFLQDRVTKIDPTQKQVSLQNNHDLSYDHLIYALGSHIDQDMIPGIREHTYTLNSPAGSTALHQHINKLTTDGHIAICGGGLTGIELATELAESHPDAAVSIITKEEFGASFSHKGERYLKSICQRLQISIVEHHEVTEFTENKIHCDNDITINADVIVWAGAMTVSPLAQQSGLPTMPNGRISVNDALQVKKYPEIYVVGDAAYRETSSSKPIRMACATAMPMGTYVGEHLSRKLNGKASQPFRFRYMIWCISLGRQSALIQLVHENDQPRERIITGRFGALIKELICRFTTWSFALENRFPGSYAWPQAPL